MPTSLLIARRRRDKITPVYAETGPENTEIASKLINLYSEHVGKKKGLLNEAVSELEQLEHDYRFIRGLATLLDRRCQLETKAVVEPAKVRKKLFEAASDKGIPTSEPERAAIFTLVARALGVDVDGLEQSLYSDLEDELFLVSFDPISAVDLLKQYNLSLTQTLLFNASQLSFTASGNWQVIFRQIKWLGLIYTVSSSGSNCWVKVDGSTSLFKLHKRYGTAIAKLIPIIFSSSSWQLRATVLSRSAGRRLYSLELDSQRHGKYMKQVAEEEVFDSRVEEHFAAQFKTFVRDWKLLREPGPVPVGRHVMIPDFLLKKDGLEVYLEIVGFWTPEYLENKMRKLSQVSDVDMIVAVDRRLACHKFSKTRENLNLLFYRGTIPIKPVITYLQEKERNRIERESQTVHNTELNFSAPIVEAQDIAELLTISVEAVKQTFPNLKIAGYRRLPDMFVKETLLHMIREALDSRLQERTLSFAEASQLIESLGGKHPSTILEALGYQTVWHGIHPKNAEVIKSKSL